MPTKNYQDFCPESLLEGKGFGWLFGRNDDLLNSFWKLNWPLKNISILNPWAEHSTTGTTLIQMIPWSNIGSCQKLRICMHPALSILVSPHYEFYWGWKKHKKTKKKRWVTTRGTMVVFLNFYPINFNGNQNKKFKKNTEWPTQKNWVFQFRQFSIFFAKIDAKGIDVAPPLWCSASPK